MPQQLIAALDQGTTNTKAMLLDRELRPLFRAAAAMDLHCPQPGWVEQDPMQLWHASLGVLEACAEHAREHGATIAGIAICNQRETALAWDRNRGTPLAPAISWQCRRSADVCARMSAQAGAVQQSAGVPLDPLTTATKWRWMLENIAAVREAAEQRRLCFGTVDSWLLYNLSAGRLFATDTTNASRTGLLDLATLAWNEELAHAFGLPLYALPAIEASVKTPGVCTAIEPLRGVPIVSAVGDSHAALAGYGRSQPGTVKATYGTGSSLMMLAPHLIAEASALARTVAWSLPEEPLAAGTRYALEGNITMTGSAVQWVGEFLGLANPAEDAAQLAAAVDDAAGVYFVPAMVGLGAPHWDSAARGTITGLDRSHRAAHLARAAIEAIAFQVADVFFAMKRSAGTELRTLQADGGATRNDSLMQFQADVLGVPVHVAADAELSNIGAARLGGIALGWWGDLESSPRLREPEKTFQPRWRDDERQRRYAGWKDAVSRARSTRGSAA